MTTAARNVATLSWAITASHGVRTVKTALPWTNEWFRTTMSWAGIV